MNNEESYNIISFCQTGGKMNNNRFINEDTIAYGYKYALLMDGATGLGKLNSINGLTSAEWYVKIVADYLRKSFPNKYKETKKTIKNAIEYASSQIRKYEKETNMVFASYEEPSSSLTLVREVKKDNIKYLQFFALGDSSIVIKFKDNRIEEFENPNKHALNSLDDKVLTHMKELSKLENKAFLEVRDYDIIQNMLKENRSKKNTNDGYWVLGTSTEAVEHAAFLEIKKDDISQVLTHSDGFSYEILNISLEEIFNTCKTEKDLKEICLKIREIESNDELANKYPRFKKSDDMSVIIISYK